MMKPFFNRFGAFLFVLLLLQVPILPAQSTKTPSPVARKGTTARKGPAGNARIEVTAFAALPNGISKPVGGRDFLLLTVDPDSLKGQVEKEIPLPPESPAAPKGSLLAQAQQQIDVESVAHEFNVSVGFVELAQKTPQTAPPYRDEPNFRRLFDYEKVDELKKSYDLLVRKKIKKGTWEGLPDEQKVELLKALDDAFDKLPPTDKTAIAVRLAERTVARENEGYQAHRQLMEQRNAALEQRSRRLDELCRDLEKNKKAFRSTSDPNGVAKFLRLPAGNYWIFADNFTFEGITSSWNIPVILRRNEVRRVEVMIGMR